MKKRTKIISLISLILFVFSFSFRFVKEKVIETEIQQNSLALFEKNTAKSIKQLAVFIKFSDSDANVVHHLDDKESVSNAYSFFNSSQPILMDTVKGKIEVPSFKTYYERESYGNLSITTEIFPKINNEVVSYMDSHPIGYYLKYSENNPIGYKNKTQSLQRETELVNQAILAISKMVQQSGITQQELDVDQDGIVDAITFIIEGQKNLPSSIAFNDLLWSHKLDNTDIRHTILDKKVSSYTLLYAEDYTEAAGLFSMNRGTYGTIIHEFGHMLGFKDLYRYGKTDAKPVGFYDIMGDTIGSNPQSFLTYFTSEYHGNMNWHTPLPVITKTTKEITLYKPKFKDKSEQRAIKIEVGGNKKEYFIVEYHDKLNTYDSYSADASGIIIYRVNDTYKFSGNGSGANQGQEDYIYVFRPNETDLGAGRGDLSLATLNKKRPVFGKSIDFTSSAFDKESIFFSNGSNSGLRIEVTKETSESITFNVLFQEKEGQGTKEQPYLIRDVKTFLYLMGQDTKNQYYKLMNDLDFKDVSYASTDFFGNLDGNHKTIRNISTTNTGVFNFVGDRNSLAKIENLVIENIFSISDGNNYLGGLANVVENTSLTNVHLISGEIKHKGSTWNDLASTGGFVGNADEKTIIKNCSSSISVHAPKNVGGFIGLNQNAKIEDSFFDGKVTGDKKVGSFIGLQAINSSVYQEPKKVYYKKAEIPAVGGYVESLHNLQTLPISSLDKGLVGVSIPSKITLSRYSSFVFSIQVEPQTFLNYTVNIENPNLLSYENQTLYGNDLGTTFLFVDIPIGERNMRLTTEIEITQEATSITEQDVLNFLGLTKKDKYVFGFSLGTTIEEVIQKIAQDPRIKVKHFINEKKEEIFQGRIGTGLQFTLSFNQIEYTYTIVLKGDVNGDGFIYATDYVKVRNHIMGKGNLTGAYLLAADINEDTYIYATDYVQIKNHIMGKKPIVQR